MRTWRGAHAVSISNGSVPSKRCAFTIVELLVVMSVIGLLIGLLLPAIQQARESARRVQCRNQLRQLALAIHNHEATFTKLPSNGWGWQWMGEPDRGVGLGQPGGWIYQILPQIEQAGLRQRGSGEPDAQRRVTLGKLTQVNLSILRCPTRASPKNPASDPNFAWINCQAFSAMSRTDYAINTGDYIGGYTGGPANLAEGDSSTFVWPDTSLTTGVCFQRSIIGWRDVIDGQSNVYLIGEKRVSTAHYLDFNDPGFDESPFTGSDIDIERWTELPPLQDSVAIETKAFGSAHAGIVHMALCDGSVRAISLNIDAETHRRLGNRRDQQPVVLGE